MASSSPPSTSDGPQQKQKDEQSPSSPPGKDECGVHKTKTIQFFGRTTPVILQNDNGPCPLLAICNVLLLKNQLNLNPDTSEVSQEKLLSLVAERLIDSNSNVNNKDSGYVENQQQNIADAIDLLPRLTTGIDVNIKFRRIDDFEFTPECAIFDLLDIPLYHGWIVDPQDHETAAAIGSKSYNTLMGELVFLETRKMEKHNDKSEEDCTRKIVKCNDRSEEDSVDFAAATAAALGVPSPCLSRTKSSEDSLCCASYEPKVRKGDAEEEAELVRVLTLSETEQSTKSDSSVMHGYFVENVSDDYDGNVIQMRATLEESTHGMELHDQGERSDQKPSKSGGHVVISTSHDEAQTEGLIPELADSYPSSSSVANDIDRSVAAQVEEVSITTDVSMKPIIDTLVQDEVNVLVGNNSAAVPDSDRVVSLLSTLVVDLHDRVHTQNGLDNSDLTGGNIDIDSLGGQGHSTEATGSFALSLDGNEPIYEGEDCILGSKSTVSKDHEPVYEGEMVLAQKVDNVKDGEPIYEGETVVVEQGNKGGDVSPMVEIIETKGELIRNFLKNSASQLTIYGLFCLQDGLKERELCVFFRNNHFNTMFKYQGELYILATDQGYINQPDLVWEKLNEVNGDTLFMTNNFKEFRLDSQSSAWDQHSAVASTTDYLATLDNSSHSNSDLQLAIALQQQEFEQQPQRRAPQQALGTGSSRLITGPQQQPSRPNVKPSSSSPRQDSKSKEKCTIM